MAPFDLHETFQSMVNRAVEKALRDPALVAAALVKMPQEIRDHVRVLLDALELGSPRVP